VREVARAKALLLSPLGKVGLVLARRDEGGSALCRHIKKSETAEGLTGSMTAIGCLKSGLARTQRLPTSGADL
jgi:hypothetical protein